MLLRRRRAREGNPAVPSKRLPAVNAHVEVSTGSSAARPSRVEDAAGRTVVVSWPTDAAGHRLPGEPGDAVSLTWTSRWGFHRLEGSIVETRAEPVPLWCVRPLAAPPALQRRDAFRLETHLRVVLHAEEAVEATIVDLSEGGFGFVVAAEDAPRPGQAVETTLPIGDGDIPMRGTVVRIGDPAGGRRSGGVRFEGMTEEAATRLRRYVLQEQIRRRSTVRD